VTDTDKQLDQAKLTAYALGELDEPAAAEVELWLSGDPAARKYVDLVRQEARVIGRAYHARSATLTDAQHDALDAAIGSEPTPSVLKTLGIAAGLAAAACIALFVILQPGGDTAEDGDGLSQQIAQIDVEGGNDRLTDELSRQTGAKPAQPTDAPPAPGFLADAAATMETPAPSMSFFGQAAAPGKGAARSRRAADTAGATASMPTTAYTVAAGDTLVGIAEKQLNNQVGWEIVARLNADRVPDPNNLQPGQEILLPDLEQWRPPTDREAYDHIADNPFLKAADHPLSTFSIDVDTASYANLRRFLLKDGKLPPKDAVRIEEMVNYFDYDYTDAMDPARVVGPDGAPHDHAGPAADQPDAPFAASVEIAPAPWAPQHRLVRIGLTAPEADADQRPASNIVFLLDVSGSMNHPDKLPLLKQAFTLFTNELSNKDRVAIVVYAGSSGLVLPSTEAGDRQKILDALNILEAGGSTAGGAGIQLAYQVALENYIPGGVNRVILATDGDFNVGTSDTGSLIRLVEEKANPKPETEHAGKAVYLSVLGFGSGNLNDEMMEQISNKGNGNYSYIDSIREAQKVLVEQMGGTLHAVAKDVKIQVEFNPAKVESYRLIGYENRMLRAEDFNDDTADAGDIGAGHTVTALYQVVPVGAGNAAINAKIAEHRAAISNIEGLMELAEATGDRKAKLAAQITAHRNAIRELRAQLTAERPVDDLRYQDKPQLTDAAAGDELMTLKVRYKAPDAEAVAGTSTLLEFPIVDAGGKLDTASGDFKFASAVAGFGMLLRDSPHKGSATFASVTALAEAGKGLDNRGYRAQLIEMITKAASLRAAEGE